MTNNTDHGPALCIAMKGQYKCEKPKRHDGPHTALGGEMAWGSESEPRYLSLGSDQ